VFGLLFRLIRFVLTILVVVFVLIQFVPYRLQNPPVVSEPKWDRAQTRALVVASCYDCHSNETKSHWYTKVAPVSWLAVREVRKGRAALDFSAWTETPNLPPGAIAQTVADGSMPPAWYPWFHHEVKLSKQERAELLAGLRKTFGSG
jgi:mono/diheme cytochrome c family protein